MKTRIYKYPLVASGEQIIPMPEGAVILTIKVQRKEPMMWAMVNPEMPDMDRVFAIRTTGSERDYNPADKYLGSFMLLNDNFVGHVFELQKLTTCKS